MGIITAYPDKTPASDGDKYLTVAEDGSTRLTTLDTMRDGVLTPGSVDADTLAQSAKPQFKIGQFKVTSTGLKSVTGIGFKPKLVKFTALFPESSVRAHFSQGAMDAAGGQYAATTSYANTASSGFRVSRADGCIAENAGNNTSLRLFGSFSSMDNDGFTINISTFNSPESEGNYAYEAHG